MTIDVIFHFPSHLGLNVWAVRTDKCSSVSLVQLYVNEFDMKTDYNFVIVKTLVFLLTTIQYIKTNGDAPVDKWVEVW